MLYSRFTRFIFPLFLTLVIYELGGPIVNSGMARLPNAAQTLAGFGIAWILTAFIISPFGQLNQLVLVLGSNHQSKGKILNFVLIGCCLMGAVLALLALTPLGVLFIQNLHRLDVGLTSIIRYVFLCFIPYPFIEGLIRFYSGLLLRAHRTEVTALATFIGIGVSILTVLISLKVEFIRNNPIHLPILATYTGACSHLIVTYLGNLRFSPKQLFMEAERKLSYGYILRFFWPLALTMSVQGISRPTVNLFISRGPDGVEAMAVLAVVYSLGHIPYGWLNELRSLASAFKNEPNSLSQIKKFICLCGLISFSSMALAFWTPVREFILIDLMALSGNIVDGCMMPLIIFALFPIVVATRSYFHGVALKKRQTKFLAPSGPSRIIAILLALILLPYTGLSGATIGVAALFCGFVCETITVAIGMHFNKG